MTHYMLFCTAEESKAFVPQIMAAEVGQNYYIYGLVETRQGPPAGQRFREILREDESFETDFIGASADECGAWMLKQQGKHNRIYDNIMVILDARSADDQTVTVWVYPIDVEAPYLRRDQEVNTWYSYRLHYSKVDKLAVQFTDTGSPHETYGIYFRRKEELTAEDGLFDVDKAYELIGKGEGCIMEEDQYDDRYPGTS